MSKVTVILKGPVKIGADWFIPGATAEVEPELAAELEASGLVKGADDQVESGADEQPVITMTASDLDQAVADRAQVIAETIVAQAVERAVDFLTSERDEALAGKLQAETERDEARAALEALKVQSTEQAREDATPPAAKSTRKGAAAPKA